VKPNIIFETLPPKEISQTILQNAAAQTFVATKSELIGNIHVAFVDKPESKRLNNEFADNNYATDVLSFVYETATTKAELKIPQAKAEIVICTPIARAQAAEYGLSFQDEVALLLVHGLLHVLGLDHQDDSQKTGFERTQNDIMNALGLKPRKMQWLH
jgi:probable rRNA maturation factor